MEIRLLGPGDDDVVLAAGALFDEPPRPEWVARFLAHDGHHLMVAYVDDAPVGFITGIEMLHPDKGMEMLLYELGVDEAHRRRGIGRALSEALLALARRKGGYGMWVPVEPSNDPAVATYRSAGSGAPEDATILAWTIPAP